MKLGIVVVLTLGLSGCYTIYFHNGQPPVKETTVELTHNIMAFDLVEVSSPVDLKEECHGKDWRTVKTELTFVNGLLGILTEPIYGPRTVGIGCQ